jgi:hypothetical protein
LLVSSFGGSDVQRYDGTTGAFIDEFIPPGSGGLNGAHKVGLGNNVNILVSSTEGHAVLNYDSATGAFLGQFVTTGSGGINRPHTWTFGPDGNLYVSDNVGGGSIGCFVLIGFLSGFHPRSCWLPLMPICPLPKGNKMTESFRSAKGTTKQAAKKAAARPGARGQGGRGKRRARDDRRDAGTGPRHGRAAPCDHQSQRASPFAETLVRDARVCQGR